MAANTRSAPRRSSRKSWTRATRGATAAPNIDAAYARGRRAAPGALVGGWKTRPRRLPAATVLIVLALAALPSAAAAERSVPRGWLGVIADGPLTSGGAMDG